MNLEFIELSRVHQKSIQRDVSLLIKVEKGIIEALLIKATHSIGFVFNLILKYVTRLLAT